MWSSAHFINSTGKRKFCLVLYNGGLIKKKVLVLRLLYCEVHFFKPTGLEDISFQAWKELVLSEKLIADLQMTQKFNIEYNPFYHIGLL